MSTVAVYVLVEQPRQELRRWCRALAALDAAGAPRLARVVGHYDRASDLAMLELQYDRSTFDELGRMYVVNVALVANIGMIQPYELSAAQRQRCLAARLARCTLRGTPQSTVVGALTELVCKLEGTAARAAATPPPIPSARPRNAAIGTPRPSLPAAKGTRDKLQARVVISEPDDDSLTTSPYEVRRHAPAGSTSPRYADEDEETLPRVLDAVDSIAADQDTRDRIHVRYLSAGRWLAARIGAIGLNGAALLASTLARVGDAVDVELRFAEHRAVVRSMVAKTATVDEAASMAAAAFTVTFALDDQSRECLFALLLAARKAKLTIKPPRRRAFRRSPIERFFTLTTANGVVKATALDMSAGGMFVRPTIPLLLDTTLSFTLSLDDGKVPIDGRARVVRRISDADAQRRGLVSGFGLAIVGMTEAHRVRWREFVARVERRADKRVLISAPPARFAELRAGLASLGYAVIDGAEADILDELVHDHAPADAVLLDASWQQGAPSTTGVHKLLAIRHVPCVKADREISRVREAMDRVLEIA